MQLVKSTTLKRINVLHKFCTAFLIILFLSLNNVLAQDNSPYSRFGIGDLTPATNILNRAMGGISAGYADAVSVNFANPASYAYFQALKEQKSKKIVSGRAVFDIGIDVEGRTLQQSNPDKKFNTSNALFSYIQIGVPIKNNWGMALGLRPISRISYNLYKNEFLKDPNTGLPIDSAQTSFKGDGGAYLLSIGSGFDLLNKINAHKAGMESKLSVGINAGLLFGTKDYKTHRSFINDTLQYQEANYETRTHFNDLFLTAGLIYKIPVDTTKRISLSLGLYGNWGQKINASQDVLRETFIFDDAMGDIRLDSVSDKRNVKGKIELPASYTFGFALQKPVIMVKDRKEAGWLVGVDFTMNNWDKYRFYGVIDSIKNNWTLKIGGQLSPIPSKSYFSNVTYRFGLRFGPEYVKVGKAMNSFGTSFGMGLPIALNRQAPNQYSVVNLAFEYSKRGSNTNLLRENMFRFSLGFSLSDLWFGKRKYD